MSDDHAHDPADLVALATSAAQAAGAELLARYGRIQGLQTKSSATDPVSDADRAAEDLVVRLLTEARPQDGLIGEEGADRLSGSGITWVIDPLDGTVNYLYRLDNFAVSIAACDAQGELAGAVHDPVANRTFTAVRGQGAFENGRRLQVNDPVPLDRALIGTGFGYLPSRRARQAQIIRGLLPQVRDIRRIGSAALDLCAVAAGRLDGYYEEGVQHWDVAAGGLIAREAGAVMTSLVLTDASTGWVVAGPALQPSLERSLREVATGVFGG